jgi:putative ABC transport system permease protein
MYGISNSLIRTPGDPQTIPSQLINAGPGFPTVYGIKLLAGRFLSEQRGEDASTFAATHNLVINVSGARRLGLSAEAAVGRQVTIEGRGTGTIVGVLSDAKLDGIRAAVEPALYYFDAADNGVMTLLSIRIRGERVADTLAFIDRTWRSFSAGTAIDRYYLADAYERLFEPDERQGELLTFFVGIAIFIACLGLFGLTVFTAERRTKEIGVRKIAGARTRDILALMLWRISVPVLIANLIAWPLADYYLSRWLEGYAYRISLSPVYFLAGAAAALLIAWGTVFAHTLRLARASPVNALRYE